MKSYDFEEDMAHTSRSRHPIVALAPNDWHGTWMNRQQLLSRLGARGWPVVYSTGALSIWDREKPAWATANWKGQFEQTDGILVDKPGRAVPRWPRMPLWDQFAVRHHFRRLSKASGRTSKKERIAFLFSPSFLPYVDSLHATYIVYHVFDVYKKMQQWTPELECMDRILIERADLLTASSESIAQNLPSIGPTKARILHNAGDAKLFMSGSNSTCPFDLAAIPQPRISFAGLIHLRVDLGMIAEVARRRPEWHWVLIGEVNHAAIAEDAEAREGLAACRHCSNIHFLGKKPYREIPVYLNHMDVNTICYRIRPNEWIISGYPVKLHEYLAVGKPIVACPQEAVKRLFSSVVDIAHTPDEWVAAIEHALTSGGVGTFEERRAVAKENTWDQRVGQLEEWLFEMIAFS